MPTAPIPTAVEADEPHIALAKELNRQLKSTAAGLGLRIPPWPYL